MFGEFCVLSNFEKQIIQTSFKLNFGYILKAGQDKLCFPNYLRKMLKIKIVF